MQQMDGDSYECLVVQEHPSIGHKAQLPIIFLVSGLNSVV